MGVTLFLSFLVLFLIGVPLAAALGLSSMFALYLHTQIPVMTLVQEAYTGIDSFTLMAVPFFILSGNIMSQGGVSTRLVALTGIFFGRGTGGSAQVATSACALFGAVSGSAPATTAAVGAVTAPPMKAKGYSTEFAAACLASSGVISLLIPPSISMIIYGAVTRTPVGELFLCGLIPGLIMTAALMGVNYFLAAKNGFTGEERPTLKETWQAVRESFFAVLMPVIILGGIYTRLFLPTEAAVVAAAYGIFVGMFVYRELTLRKLLEVIMSTAKSSAAIMILVSLGNCFIYVLTLEEAPRIISQTALGLTRDPRLLLLLICASLLLAGAFLDNVAAVVLMTPLLYPIVQGAGINPVFFGVLLTLALAIGQITPPVGTCLSAASHLTGLNQKTIAVYCLPYLVMMTAVMIGIIFFPGLVMFMPSGALP